MPIPKKLFFPFILLFGMAGIASVHAQISQPQAGPSLYRSPTKEIRVDRILLEGNRTVDRSLIINTIQIQEGEEYLPPVLRQRVQASVNALHKLGLFSDIRVDQVSPDTSDGIHIVFSLTELPTLARAEIEGNKKLKRDDIKEVMDLLDGQVYSRSAVERNRQKILKLYQDKGYLLAVVKAEEGTEEATGRKTVTYRIQEGKKVRVRYIAFQGNRQVPDANLRKRLGTKEDRWWPGRQGARAVFCPLAPRPICFILSAVPGHVPALPAESDAARRSSAAGMRW